jgi:hypothetical protein
LNYSTPVKDDSKSPQTTQRSSIFLNIRDESLVSKVPKQEREKLNQIMKSEKEIGSEIEIP